MAKRITYKLIGQTFGRLTVTGIAGSAGREGKAWNCTCECGETTIMTTHDLKKRHRTDCGCTRRAIINARKAELMREAGLDVNSCPPLWISMELNKL